MFPKDDIKQFQGIGRINPAAFPVLIEIELAVSAINAIEVAVLGCFKDDLLGLGQVLFNLINRDDAVTVFPETGFKEPVIFKKTEFFKVIQELRGFKLLLAGKVDALTNFGFIDQGPQRLRPC